MNATNPPLEQWQIDHIRKMQQELGLPQMAPDAEEVPMDEDLENGADTETEDALPASGNLGGLGAADAFSAYQTAQKSISDQINANINLLTAAQKKLRERRAGPSNSEKWLAIAAALGKPTKTGSFGESLGNLNETLLSQEAMKRKAQEERDMLLEQYGMKIGNEQLRMLQSGASQAGQLYRAALAANKKTPEFSYQLDAYGNVKEVPKKVHRPTTDAEYAAIPIGQYYVIPSGQDAGKVVVKR